MTELYTFKIFNTWDPISNSNFWEATIEVPISCSLYDFHLFIQKTVDFDNDHLFDFYAGRNKRNRKIVFTEEPGLPYKTGDYSNILLKDIYPITGLKLFYLFDYGDNWVFEIRKSRKKAQSIQGTKYPRIVEDNGVKLRQYKDEEW